MKKYIPIFIIIFLMFVIAALFLPMLLTAQEFPAIGYGATAIFHFNEGSGSTTTDSQNGLVGTLLGGMDSTGWVTGKYGTALQFDGINDTVSTPVSSNFKPSTSFSVACWVYINNAVPSDFYAFLVSGGTNGVFWFGYGEGNPPHIYTNLNGISGGTEIKCCYSSLQIHTWYHVAYTYSSATSTRVVYLNGVSSTTVTSGNGTPQDSSQGNYIGSYYGGMYWMNGIIDDFAFSNTTVWSPTDIAALYADQAADHGIMLPPRRILRGQ